MNLTNPIFLCKIDWGIVKNILISLLNTKIKIDKKFIKEFTHSKYSANIDRKLQNVKANIAYYLQEIIENSGHVK
ncbi:MAG: hypothetical protein IJ593_06900, partial [Lachnospiraceae bacterium]|nr:hypothetical protein [Lachnospiraceae bacterium]